MSRATRHHDIETILARARRGSAPSHRSARRGRRSFYERARRRQGSRVMSLNLTPMIDTVFNLLFFFMVVSRFGAIEGLLPGKLPVRGSSAQAAGPAVPRMPIRIRLHPQPAQPGVCYYSIDRLVETQAPLRELPARMEAIRRDEPGFGTDTPVHLVAGDDVAWDHLVNAYNAALGAGYDRIFFATTP